MKVRGFFGISSGMLRDLAMTAPEFLRELFGSSRRNRGYFPKKSRSRLEAPLKRSRRNPEAIPAKTRSDPEGGKPPGIPSNPVQRGLTVGGER